MTSLSENRRRKLRLPALLAALVLLFSLPACSVGSSAVSSDTASVSSEVSSAPESSSDTPSSDTTSFEIPSETPLTSFFSSDYVKGEYGDEYSSMISSETPSVPAEPIYINVWSPSEDGQSISYAVKEVTSVTYSKVFSLLRKAGVVSSAISVNNFSRSYDGEKSYLMLDLSENFTSYLKNCGREDAVMGSIVNTFLEAYGAEKILITVKKYTLKTSRIHMPARIDAETEARIRETAKALYRILGCSGFARVDMFLTPEGEIVFNEINTIPGFTSHSRYPNMMKGIGLGFAEIVNRLIEITLDPACERVVAGSY